MPKVGPKTAVTLLNKYGSLDNIITHSNELKGKLRENIESSLDTINLAKKLVALKDDLKLNIKTKELVRSKIDEKKFKIIIKKYELKSLSTKLNIKSDKKNKKRL